MVPQLVEYDKLFQKKDQPIQIKKPIIQIDNQLFYFNVFGILSIMFGLFILYSRKKAKKVKKKRSIQNIFQFYHNIH
tara:strand:- start:5745 stop:5975 length:231 start_codon:yes stop_codon:yes gene_type:complete